MCDWRYDLHHNSNYLLGMACRQSCVMPMTLYILDAWRCIRRLDNMREELRRRRRNSRLRYERWAVYTIL